MLYERAAFCKRLTNRCSACYHGRKGGKTVHNPSDRIAITRDLVYWMFTRMHDLRPADCTDLAAVQIAFSSMVRTSAEACRRALGFTPEWHVCYSALQLLRAKPAYAPEALKAPRRSLIDGLAAIFYGHYQAQIASRGS